MNRRGFLSSLIAVPVAASVAPKVLAPPMTEYDQHTNELDWNYPKIERANGSTFIVGIAMETVHVGDLVQIQASGPVRINVK